MKYATLLLLFFTLTFAHAQISVSDNGKFLRDSTGHPFFWLGDTDWELFHRLTREEAADFLEIRHQQGFNIIQAVALAEFNGVREPNRYGDYPLNNEDPTQLLITPGNDPNNAYQYDYWDNMDYIIHLAESKGMYIGLLPTWGDKVAHLWGDGPIIFDSHNAEVYGRTLASRYKINHNIIWILGGDRPAVYHSDKEGKDFDDLPVWRAMARGIESVLGPEAFITYHPSGGKRRTTDYLLHEGWLDMHAFQSGHGSKDADPWNWVMVDNKLEPGKPTLDMEPCYEDHPVNPWDGKWTRKRGYFTAYDVRARIYRGVFAGACGVTYGHHHVWQFLNPTLYTPINPGDTLIDWRKATHAEAATEMQYLKRLMLSRPYFSRIEDKELIASDPGSSYLDFMGATRDSEGSFAMVYLPMNNTVNINLGKVNGNIKNVWWFDPRSGKCTGAKPVKGKGVHSFNPPTSGQDWVLVLDDGSKKFPAPGTSLFVSKNP